MKVLGRNINSNGNFLLDKSKKFFTVRALKHWNRFPREMGESLYSEIFKTQVDKSLCNQFSIHCQLCFEQTIWLQSHKLFCDSIHNHFNKFYYVYIKVDFFLSMIFSCARSGKSCIG